jgi:predicted nucleic acid-binding Zn ribbon protein
MSSVESLSPADPEAARAPARGAVVASRLCPICQKTRLTPRQRYCSGRCRAQASRDAKRQKILGHLRAIERLLEP